MTADEIRKVAKQATGRELKDALAQDYNRPELFSDLIRLEIAAQLAELNETLDTVVSRHTGCIRIANMEG